MYDFNSFTRLCAVIGSCGLICGFFLTKERFQLPYLPIHWPYAKMINDKIKLINNRKESFENPIHIHKTYMFTSIIVISYFVGWCISDLLTYDLSNFTIYQQFSFLSCDNITYNLTKTNNILFNPHLMSFYKDSTEYYSYSYNGIHNYIPIMLIVGIFFSVALGEIISAAFVRVFYATLAIFFAFALAINRDIAPHIIFYVALYIFITFLMLWIIKTCGLDEQKLSKILYSNRWGWLASLISFSIFWAAVHSIGRAWTLAVFQSVSGKETDVYRMDLFLNSSFNNSTFKNIFIYDKTYITSFQPIYFLISAMIILFILYLILRAIPNLCKPNQLTYPRRMFIMNLTLFTIFIWYGFVQLLGPDSDFYEGLNIAILGTIIGIWMVYLNPWRKK